MEPQGKASRNFLIKNLYVLVKYRDALTIAH